MAHAVLHRQAAATAVPPRGSGCGLENGKARDACLGNWGASEPLRDPDEVDGSGRDDVLEVYLGQADVTGATEAAATDGLRVRTLNAGAGGIAGPKRLGLCIDSCHLHATGYDVRTPEGTTAAELHSGILAPDAPCPEVQRTPYYVLGSEALDPPAVAPAAAGIEPRFVVRIITGFRFFGSSVLDPSSRFR